MDARLTVCRFVKKAECVLRERSGILSRQLPYPTYLLYHLKNSTTPPPAEADQAEAGIKCVLCNTPLKADKSTKEACACCIVPVL